MNPPRSNRTAGPKPPPPSPQPADPPFTDRLPLGPLLTLLVTILATSAIRLRLLSMPLERDEGEYAYAGQLILHVAL